LHNSGHRRKTHNLYARTSGPDGDVGVDAGEPAAARAVAALPVLGSAEAFRTSCR